MNKYILKSIRDNAELLDSLAKDDEIINKIDQLAKKCCNAHTNGGKIIFAGNGGSAADSQHLVAELVGRYNIDRDPIRAIALTCDTSVITAISNDYGYPNVFSRQFDAIADENDVYITFSTSGKSQNIIQSLKIAKEKKVYSVCFTGKILNNLDDICDEVFRVNSKQTDRIQEIHILLGHILCGLIERYLFK